jgi:PilZ domain-containing protein
MMAWNDCLARLAPQIRELDCLSMAIAPARRRAEKRTSLRLFVKLSIPETNQFEVAHTLDISRHGALVVTKRVWAINEHLLLRSLRGNFSSYARVAHCKSLADHSFAIGLQLFNPTGDWPTQPLAA